MQLDSAYRLQARAGEELSVASLDIDVSATKTLDLAAGSAVTVTTGSIDVYSSKQARVQVESARVES